MIANPDFSIITKSLYNYRKRANSITNSSNTFDQEIEERNRLLNKSIKLGNDKYLKFFVISYINTIYKKYGKFSQNNIVFRYFNYNKLHKLFIKLDKLVKFEDIKEEIGKYKEITDIKNTIKTFFSVTNSKDKSHKNITILGIKIKIKLK